MPLILDRLKLLIEDLKTAGWYFRVYLGLAVVATILSFTALIVLSKESSSAAREKDWSVWVENKTSISFPDVAFEFDETSRQHLISVVCYHDNTPIAISACPNSTFSKCALASCSKESAYPTGSSYGVGSSKINCMVVANSTNSNTLEANGMLFVRLPGPDSGMSLFSMGSYVRPNDNTWIILDPVQVDDWEGESTTSFFKNVVYHTTSWTPFTYKLSFVVDSFVVLHYEQSDNYNGWQAAADIGGFSFFMLIIHALLMMFGGIFLANRSQLLLGSAAVSELTDTSSKTQSENITAALEGNNNL